jgi:hypothetical protein
MDQKIYCLIKKIDRLYNYGLFFYSVQGFIACVKSMKT